MAMDSEQDVTLTASGRIEALLDLREDTLEVGPVVFRKDQDGLRFEVSLDVQRHALADVEAMSERVGLAVRSAILAASGAAAQVHVEDCSYPSGGGMRRVTVFLATSRSVQVFLDREPESAIQGARAFEAVMAARDPRLPQLYEVYWLGAQALQTIAPVVGLWAFTTILEEESRKRDLSHLESLLEQMSRDGYGVDRPKSGAHYNHIRASALHANPENWMPDAEDVRWFHEAARQYLSWRAEKGPSENAKRKIARIPVATPGRRHGSH